MWFECPSVSPSVLCLCFSLCFCVFSIVVFLPVDVVGWACLCPCLWCVSVVFVYCGCSVFPVSLCCHVLCLCSVWFYLFKQLGIGLPKVLLHLSNTVDDLESISTKWRRDYLSAIKLLGNLFQTTLAHDDFPSILAPPLLSCQIPKSTLPISILLPNSLEHHYVNLYWTSAKPFSADKVNQCREQMAKKEAGWTHLTPSEGNI